MASIKVLFIGYNVAHTGFTRVMHSIIANLGTEFDIHYAALGLDKGHATYPYDRHITVHHYDDQGKYDPLRVHMVSDFLQKEKPDMVFLLNDFWFLKHYHSVFKNNLGDAKLIYYAPIDGQLKEYQYLQYFDVVDEVVAYTEFGKNEIHQGISTTLPREKRPKITTLPHGIDTKRFIPLGDISTLQSLQQTKQHAKQQLWGEQVAHPDAFVVLNANRPQSRKCIDITIEGFAAFAKGKPDHVKLCLHHAVMPFGEEEMVKGMIKKFGIEDRVIFSKTKSKDEYISDEQLNLIYNACDVGINTSQGEGWGLISFEHAATGAAQIVPAHSACHELWQETGLLLHPIETVRPEKHPMEFQKVGTAEVTKHLETLYTNRDIWFNWSMKAYHNAQQPKYNWSEIGQQWAHLFKNHVYDNAEV